MTKILLVEDDKSLREIYGVRLLAEGYDIVSAGDGEEALAMAIKDRPALIVSDVMMPKISGFDMLDILRSTTETKNIKVIMMTALSSEDQRKRGEQLGADRYLVKSQVGIEDVVRTVHEVLGDSPVVSPTPFGSASPATPTATPSPAPQAQSSTTAAPGPRPAASVAPPSRPAPTPVAAAPPQPATLPVSEPEPATLPQPTAPFSTPRPGAGTGNALADRVIQPISQPDDGTAPISDLIAEELSKESPTPAPVNTPTQPPASAPPAASTPPSSVPTTPIAPPAATPVPTQDDNPPSPQTPPVSPPQAPTA